MFSTVVSLGTDEQLWEEASSEKNYSRIYYDSN